MSTNNDDLPEIPDPLYDVAEEVGKKPAPAPAPAPAQASAPAEEDGESPTAVDIPEASYTSYARPRVDPHKDTFDSAVKMAFVGAGQGGGRIAQSFYNFGYRRVCAVNCLDAETEALTQRGWVKGFDLSQDDVLLTKNPESGKLEWESLTDLKLYPDYEGELIEFKSKSFHAVTTPEHRWLVTQQWDGAVGECTSGSISLTGAHRIHRTGDYTPELESGLTPDEAELLGWFVTDGGLRLDRKTPRAFIYQSFDGNPEKCERISKLLVRLGDEAKLFERKEGTYYEWALGPRLSQLLHGRCPERTLTPQSMLDLDRTALERLREAMILGDGTCGGREALCTGRKDQADAFQMLCTLTGAASGSSWRDMSSYAPQSEKLNNVPKMTGVWYVTALKRDRVQVVGDQARKFWGKVPVWCPVVPNTFFVARRSGYVFITGNTTNQDLKGLKMPDDRKMVIGNNRGGAGKDPEQGELAVKESYEDVMDLFMRSWGEGAEYLYVCVGGGGGSGTGAWPVLLDAMREYAKSTNIEKPFYKSLGVIMTIPKRSEGARVQRNALTAIQQAIDKLNKNQISSLLLVDNSKIHELYPGLPVKMFWKVANDTFTGIFHTFNLLAAQDSDYNCLDRADYRSVIKNGMMIFGRTRVPHWRGKEDISQAVRQNLKGSLLADGFDLAKADMAGAIVVAHDDVFNEIPMENIDYAFNSLGRVLGNEGITLHNGIYEGKQKGMQVFTIVSGLEPPQSRLDELENLAK